MDLVEDSNFSIKNTVPTSTENMPAHDLRVTTTGRALIFLKLHLNLHSNDSSCFVANPSIILSYQLTG